MTVIIAQTIGVDISKHTLDVHLHPQAAARQFTILANVLLRDGRAWHDRSAAHA